MNYMVFILIFRLFENTINKEVFQMSLKRKVSKKYTISSILRKKMLGTQSIF